MKKKFLLHWKTRVIAHTRIYIRNFPEKKKVLTEVFSCETIHCCILMQLSKESIVNVCYCFWNSMVVSTLFLTNSKSIIGIIFVCSSMIVSEIYMMLLCLVMLIKYTLREIVAIFQRLINYFLYYLENLIFIS